MSIMASLWLVVFPRMTSSISSRSVYDFVLHGLAKGFASVAPLRGVLCLQHHPQVDLVRH